MQPAIQLPTAPRRVERPSGAPASVWLARLAMSTAFVAVVALGLSLMGSASYGLTYRGLIYPGVSAWGVDLSGKSPAEAAAAFSAAFNYPSSSAFTLKEPRPADEGDARTWSATPAQLGVTFDLPASISAAYNVGRTGNVIADAVAQFQAWYAGVQVAPIVVYDEHQTIAYLNNVAQEVFEPVSEASLTASGASVTTTPGRIGRQLEVLATAALLREPLLQLHTAEVHLVLVETPPLVLDASAQAAQAQAILSEPITLTFEAAQPGDPGPWLIDQTSLGSLLQVRRVADSANAAHFEVGLDPVGLRAVLEPLAEPLRQEPLNARFIFNDETKQLELLQPSRAARRLNIQASLERFNAAVAEGQHAVPLVVDVTPALVADDATGEKLGITQLVSEQSTLFSGSSAERISNIQVAGARFHGLLIAPNSTFSFVEHLGDVSLDSGFAEALIIYGGRTIRGVGGGVCQVSTTVFRAAYFGGFPIGERYSHAYRVGYYERGDHWRGPGLDATVYAPLVDFKFQNDTPYWMLMEVYVNPTGGRITWKLYSTSDGRQVTVGAPDVQNVVPAPEPLYEQDDSLKTGEIKQVDYAADGADVSVVRTITRAGARVNAGERPMSTHYQPWRAVYHYGPGTEGIPTPAPTPVP